MRCVINLGKIHKRAVVSMGGVLGVPYARTRTVGSDLFRSSHAIRGEEWYHRLGSEVGFHVEGNSSSSFGGRTVLAENNVTWDTNVMVFEFVM